MISGYVKFECIFHFVYLATVILTPFCYSETVAPTSVSDRRSLNLFNIVVGSGIRDAAYPDFRYITWDQLDDQSRLAASILGYTGNPDSWNTPGNSAIEQNAFQSLSSVQQEAAKILGFQEQVWDCYVNHYQSFPWTSLESLGLAQHLVTLGWSEELWNSGRDIVPDSELKIWVNLTTEEQLAAQELCWFRFTWDYQPIEEWITYPYFRYVPWEEKELEFQETAQTVLNYTEATWNDPFTADIEYISWYFLYDEEKEGAESMGWKSANWDCYVNHYFDFSWDELETYNLMRYFTDLGYSREQWESDDVNDVPESFRSTWHSLNIKERRAAEELCWFRQIWDQEPIQEWMIYPEFRYVPWDTLDDSMRSNAAALGYTQLTWDNPGSAEVEKLSSATLTQEQFNVVTNMGFTASQWDCYVNHYKAYLWEDLDSNLNVQGFFIDLGWTEQLFTSVDGEAESDAKSWFDLTYAEQQAAKEICWQPETWDRIELSVWSSATVAPSVSISPSQTFSPSISISPSQSPSKSLVPSLSTTVAPSVSISSSQSFSPSTSIFPSQSPSKSLMPSLSTVPSTSVQPSASPSISFSPSLPSPPTNTISPSASPSSKPSASPTKEMVSWIYLYPDYRYGQWQYQTNETKEAAKALSYNKGTWNVPGTNEVEKLPFATLNENQQQAATSIGFNSSDVWDCYINHYLGYSWEALKDANVQQHMSLLGWTEENWTGTTSLLRVTKKMGTSDNKKWTELTAEQQEAASAICYFREIWDGQNLNTWTGRPASPIRFPRARFYYQWTDLTRSSKQDAQALLYTEQSWNQPNTNDLEKLSFSELNSTQQDAALSLGMKEVVWDCYISHYYSYNWTELEEVQTAFIALGWTETMWDSTDSSSPSVPESDDKDWEELSAKERDAAEEICFFEELWDGLPLKDFKQGSSNSGSRKKSGGVKTLTIFITNLATCFSCVASVLMFIN